MEKPLTYSCVICILSLTAKEICYRNIFAFVFHTVQCALIISNVSEQPKFQLDRKKEMINGQIQFQICPSGELNAISI